MRFRSTPIEGVFLIELEKSEDVRGTFFRTFSIEEFENHGLVSRIEECSSSFNRLRGTLRGLHLQLPPHAETKLVRCTRGSVWDVAVDLRENSATYRSWCGTKLAPEDNVQVYLPAGVAHGFITLEDESEVHYQISEKYQPAASTGIRWNDPSLAIDWPLEPTVMSARDASLPWLTS